MAVVSDQTIARAAVAAGFPRDQISTAVAVALAESGGDATVRNTRNADGSADHGLWQINSVHAADLAAGDWRDPAANARMALAVWTRAGRSWSPWVAWRNGRHLRFMARGSAAAAAVAPGADDDNPLIPDVIEGPADAAGDLAARTTHALAVLTDRDLWVRIGWGLLGAVFIFAAVVALMWTFGLKPASRLVTGAKSIGKKASNATNPVAGS